MGTFPTYGMAGIGIAAAIGFVFVLSFLGSNDDPGISERVVPVAPELMDQQSTGKQLTGETDFGDSSQVAKGTEATDEPGESASMIQDLRPTLTSIVALDENREVMGEIVSDMEFETGTPVVLRASYTNQIEGIIADHFIAISIRQAGEGDIPPQPEHGASFQGDIASTNTISLELYWTPQGAGNYTLLLFSATPANLASTVPVKPELSVPIRVLDKVG